MARSPPASTKVTLFNFLTLHRTGVFFNNAQGCFLKMGETDSSKYGGNGIFRHWCVHFQSPENLHRLKTNNFFSK